MSSASVEADKHPVVYAGRHVDQVTGIDLPNGCVVLGERDALPRELTEALDRASVLVLLDLSSFPFKAMTADHWDVPMVVVLSSGSGVEPVIAAFDSMLFERLGFFDHFVTPDSALWERLRREYRWAESQRLPVASDHPGEVAAAVRALLEAEPGRDQHGAARHWRDRKLAASVSRRALHGLRFDKALHRAQAAVLEPWFAAPRRNLEAPLDVLEVGAGVGRWAPSFDPAEARLVGIEGREDLLEAARAGFPDRSFDLLGPERLFPYDDESFDLVFSVTVMHREPEPARRTLLSEMWRVTRPGGRLLFLEDFVFTRQSKGPDVYPISVTEFVGLILDAMNGQVVLEHVESLRYPDEDLFRSGLISLLRLGVPSV